MGKSELIVLGLFLLPGLILIIITIFVVLRVLKKEKEIKLKIKPKKELKKCKHCGSFINFGATICNSCGKKI